MFLTANKFMARMGDLSLGLTPAAVARLLVTGRRAKWDGRRVDPRAQVAGRFFTSLRIPATEARLTAFREFFDALGTRSGFADTGGVGTRDIAMPLADRSLTGRLYSPDGVADGGPLILFFHGGGYVLGSVAGYDPICRRLAKLSGHRLLSVEYRLAPEHPWPAPVEDARDSWTWVQQNADRLGIDPERVTLSGDSAGGGLALVVANHAAATPQDNQPAALALAYPAARVTLQDEAEQALAGMELLLGVSVLEWFKKTYTAGRVEATDPTMSPALDEDGLRHMPPTLILTAGFDPLRPGAEFLRDRLAAGGRAVELYEYPTMIHGFVSLGRHFTEADDAIRRLARYVRTCCETERGESRQAARGGIV
ncbi:acetyl esterase [Paracoccus isoporae]|uniref:Acetyl esterase n=1 Tax=Paracoccus isoporae TaxID=591205 RepID=A0A1G6ZKL6_9RHOB|nr:alpha/beta hydrolase [Paracoccus isoporae]SDE02355.1 acetyl esterase [Paracoccus isoporae]